MSGPGIFGVGSITYDLETQINPNLRFRSTKPANPATWGLINTPKGLRLPRDSEGFLWGYPALLTSPNSPGASFSVAAVGGVTNTTKNQDALYVNAQTFLNNGTTGFIELAVTPGVFKNGGFTTVAATAIWTPAAGKKFRLLGFTADIGSHCAIAVAGTLSILINDGATALAIYECFLPAAAASTTIGINKTVAFGGNGFLSAAANNTLNVTLNTALTAGTGRLVAWGQEE